MANTVEIVVKSTDRTDVTRIGEKLKTKLRTQMRDAVNDIDRDTEAGFRRVGEHAGTQLGDGISRSVPRSTDKVGSQVKHSLESQLKDVLSPKSIGWDEHQWGDAGHRSGASFGKAARSGLKDVEHGFEDVGKTGFKAARDVEGGFAGAFREMGAQWKAVAIANGLAMLPALAQLAGGAITLGVGGALAGLGLYAQKGNKDVQNSFSETKNHIVSEFKQISEPFHATLLHIAADAGKAFDLLAPSLKGAFAKMAPAVTRFSASFANSLQELRPMVDSLGSAFSRVLDALGGQMPAVMRNFGTGFKAIFDAVNENPQAFASTVKSISELTRYLGDGIGVLIRYKDAISTFMDVFLGPGPLGVINLAHKIGDLGSALGNFATTGKTASGVAQEFKDSLDPGAASGFGSAMAKAAAQARVLVTANEAAKMSADQLKEALDGVTGTNLSLAQAQINQARATKAAADASDHKRRVSLDERQSLIDLAKADQDVIVQMKNHGATAGALSGKMTSLRSKFISLATQMGYSKAEAKKLANEFLGVAGSVNKIPKNHKTNISQSGAAATKSAAYGVGRALASIPRNITVNIGANIGSAVARAMGWAHGGTIGAYATGGIARAASGGPRGSLALVGEQGPELVRLPGGSTVIPHGGSMNKLRQAASGGEQTLRVEWVGGNAGDKFMAWLKENIRFVAGSGPNSVQRALGPT